MLHVLKTAVPWRIVIFNIDGLNCFIRISRYLHSLSLLYHAICHHQAVTQHLSWDVDMMHYYHARYPTDDWHLAYMFSVVYFSVDVCLVGVFPHSVNTRRDHCVRVCAPLTLASSLTRKQKSNWGWPGCPLEPSEGAFELTHGSAVLLGGNLGCWIFYFSLILHSLWGVS